MQHSTNIIPTTEPPHNIEAEQQLLGAILGSNDVFHRVSDLISDEHFYEPCHARIWQACAARIKLDHLASPVSLAQMADSDGGIMELGGRNYLIRMVGASIGTYAARAYAMIILEMHQRRQLLRAVDEARSGLMIGRDMAEVHGVIEAAMHTLTLTEVKKPSTSFLAAMTASIERTFKAYQGDASGLKCGIREFDELTGGMFPGDYIVVAGGTSMGKTSLALGIVKGVAEQAKGVAVVSLEMSEDSLAQRILASESRIPYFRLRSGDISESEGKKLLGAAQKMEAMPVEIVGPHVREIGAIYAVAKRLQKSMEKRGGLRLLVIDYIQLVRAPGRDRFQMIAEVSTGLKSLGMMLGIPVIALSQIGRDVASRDDKRPRLADLSDSSQIEKDSDMVIFTHREHYYLEREGAPRGKDGKIKAESLVDHDAALNASKSQMDLIMAKHRSGAIGERKIGCDITTNRFWSLHDTTAAMEF